MEGSITRLMNVARQIRRENLKFARKHVPAGLISMTDAFVALPPEDQNDIASAALRQQEEVDPSKGGGRMVARDGLVISRRRPDWDVYCCQRLRNPYILASLGAFVVFSKGISDRPNRTGTLTALASLAAVDHFERGESFFLKRNGTPEVRIHTAWYFKQAIGPLGRYSARPNKLCGLWASLADE